MTLKDLVAKYCKPAKLPLRELPPITHPYRSEYVTVLEVDHARARSFKHRK